MAVKAEWNNNQTDTNPALVAGVSTNQVGGGLAFVGVVGGASGYSVNSSGANEVFDVTFRHEMGHNWGCGHFVGGSPEGTGIMGGNAPARFSGPEVQAIFNHRDIKIGEGDVLDNEGVFTSVEIPPYASLDVTSFRQSVDPSISIAVLANDHDANGQTISVLSHDSASVRGGAVSRQGDNLIYSAPRSYLGMDYFSYIVTDTAGKTAKGIVLIDVQPSAELRLHLPLDEASGSTAFDKSLFKNPATISGTTVAAASTPGKFGNALNLDGVDDHVEITEMNLNSNTVTMTAWVRQGTTQNSFAGIIFDNRGAAAGLNIKNSNDLGYHWDGPVQNWRWNSGLTPPANTWTFVALVIEPSKATMYMNSGSGFQSAINYATHFPVNFTTTYVGWEPSKANRHFLGAIDDARVYDRALNLTDLQAVFKGGGAESPSPNTGAINVTSHLLKWTPGAAAVSSDIYVGTSQSAVTSATKTSPVFQGNTVDTQFRADLTNQTQYFWRVDTVTASETLKGRVWSFNTGIFPKSLLINFGEGGTQTLTGGEFIGPNGADSSNWNESTGGSGTLSGLINDAGAVTTAGVQWTSANTWRNNSSTADDEHRMSKGYLDDGTTTGGKGVRVTLSNIPYNSYRIYGLFSSDENQANGSSCNARNFNVNGTWVLGGSATTTATAWGTIDSNKSNNGTFWAPLAAGGARGNYWAVNSTGSTCTIIGEVRSGTSRGSLAGLIIEDTSPAASVSPPTWHSNPIDKISAYEGVNYSSSLAGDVSDSNPGDTLTFSKISGPAWLNVAANGALTGTPAASDNGPNQWTVRVADNGGLQADATLNITVDASVGTIFQEDFERAAGSVIGNGWIEQTNDSRIFDTASGATKMVISATAGTLYAIVNQLPNTYLAGNKYDLAWNASRAASSNGVLNYNVSIGTWDGAVFTPLASRTGSIADLKISGKVAGPSVSFPAPPAQAGQRIAVRFEVLAGSSDWVGFDDIAVVAAPLSKQQAWRLENFGTIENTGDGADSADPDGDGSTNAHEYQAGTDPNDKTSVFTITALSADNADFLINFSTVIGKTYRVEWSASLASGSWSVVETGGSPQSNIPGTGGVIQARDSNGASQTKRFYRAVVE